MPSPPLPRGTSLTIASWICPSNYVNSDYSAACRQHIAPDFQYWARQLGPLNAITAGDDGIVVFDLSGEAIRGVVVQVGYPSEGRGGRFHAAIVDCVGNAGRLETPTVTNLSAYVTVGIPVAPGDQVHCDWYNVPYGGS